MLFEQRILRNRRKSLACTDSTPNQMTARIEAAPAAPAVVEDQTFPTLTDAQIARVGAQGRLRRVDVGEVLADAGKQLAHFYVVTAGALDGLQLRENGDVRITTLRAG